MRPAGACLLVALAAGGGALACGPAAEGAAAPAGIPAGHPARLAGATMGTTYCVQVARLPGALDPAALRVRVQEVLDGIERRMSTWDPASELSRFNAAQSTEWFAVSADTLAVVAEAQRVSGLTDGAFDVTVGALVELWGFGPRGERRRPAPATLAATLAGVGQRRLATRASPPALRKGSAGLRVDLSAIAKGFAVDSIARLLDSQGARDYLVEVGGELRARGRNVSGEPWRVAVERPPGAVGLAPCVLDLEDVAVATSGDYRNAFVQDGVRYAHVIDPRTGEPVASGVVSATVLSASAMEADAFATALMVLPPDEGLRAAQRAGLEARLLLREGADLVERRTPRFPGRAP